MNLKIIITEPRITKFGLPKVETEGSAGIDLRAMLPTGSFVLMPGGVLKVDTGLRVWIEDPGYVGFVFARSGLGSKGLVLGNGTGVIDSDYQGPLTVTLWNRSETAIQINDGDRVAQLVVVPVANITPVFCDSFDLQTERGEGGFGSTGVN